MRHHGQEARFGAARRFRLIARLGERPLGQYAAGHVTADALRLAGGAGPHRDLAPGDPARACGRGDLLVVDARAVGERRGFSLFLDRKRKRGRQNVFARAAGKRTEGIVGIGDGAGAAAAHDHVALGLEKALGALLRFADFPVAIRRLVETRFHVAQLDLHLADARNEDANAAAGGTEQRRHADGERMGIVVRPGEVAPERKPNAAANDIDAMATERTASESRRRLKTAGFGRWPRGRMVPFPPGIAARLPRSWARSCAGRVNAAVSRWIEAHSDL
jgi:hypothetical protein